MSTSLRVALALGLLLRTAAMAEAQLPASLTMQQAVSIALEKNPLRKAALADVHTAAADVTLARSRLFPRLSFSETATRSNDPEYVFGTKLRQQRFQEADFALNALNTPLPRGNFSTGFRGAWNLFDSFASWHGIARAKQLNDAARQQLDRTQQEVIFQVIGSYYAVLLAGKEAAVSQQALKTAQAIVESSQARFDTGLVVESDLLAAKVRLATRKQEAIRAAHNLDLARAQLNTAMGISSDASFELAQTLEERSLEVPVLPDVEVRALENRPDLKRVALGESAQQEGVAAAKSSFGPQINVFAGWQVDNPTLFAGGGGNNWAGGIEIKFDIFEGGAKRAELSRQRSLAERAAAMKEAATNTVRLEVRKAFYDLDSSRQQIEAARAAVAQSQESLRINQDRYESGLTTVTDLLAAEDATRRIQNDYWESVFRFYTSYANLELASGTLTPQSPVVTP